MLKQTEVQAAGYYLDLNKGEFLHLGETALGQSSGKMYKVPAGIVAIAAPVFSVGYVMFLPLVSIVIFGSFGWGKIKVLAAALGRRMNDETVR